MLFVNNIKENAKRIINTELITHFCAVLFPLICGLCFIYSAIMLSDVVMTFAGEIVAGLILFAFLFFTIAMSLPLFYGLAVFETNCVVTGKADFLDMFRGYSSIYLYLRSMSFFYALFWRFLFVFSVPLLLFNQFIVYTKNPENSYFVPVSAGGYDITYSLFVLLIIVSILISALIYSNYIFASYFVVMREESPVSDCFFAAKIYRHDCKHEFLRLIMSFLPLMLLSVLSFGIIAVYTVPFMLSAIYMFAHERYTSDNLNSKLKDRLFTK